MLGQVYQDMSTVDLISLLRVAKKSGSASIQDFKDLIIEKYNKENPSYKSYVQEKGGWGFISEDIADLRYLLMEYGLYTP